MRQSLERKIRSETESQSLISGTGVVRKYAYIYIYISTFLWWKITKDKQKLNKSVMVMCFHGSRLFEATNTRKALKFS